MKRVMLYIARSLAAAAIAKGIETIASKREREAAERRERREEAEQLRRFYEELVERQALIEEAERVVGAMREEAERDRAYCSATVSFCAFSGPPRVEWPDGPSARVVVGSVAVTIHDDGRVLRATCEGVPPDVARVYEAVAVLAYARGERNWGAA